jgi:hypothetical protein
MPDAAAFSALPVFQAVSAALTLLAGVYMMLQAQRDKKAVPSDPLPDGRTMFGEGLQSLRDVVHAIGNLCMVMTQIERNQMKAKDEVVKETERLTEQTRIQTDRHGEMLRDHANILRSLDDKATAILREIRERG